MRALRVKRLGTQAGNLYYKNKAGYVYIITNPSFVGWCKVGCALDANDRLRSYQTSSPFRDYELKWVVSVEDKLTEERKAHDHLALSYERKGEWFKVTAQEAVETLENLEWN